MTYDNGNYTKSVVTKDDSTGNATVKVDVTTGTFGSGAGDKAGTVTSTAKGLATTQDVANAINSAAINVVADNTPDNKTSVKAGDTIHFAKDGNLTLVQNGTTFTYGLNSEISISKVTTSDATNGSTVQDAKGITTTDAAGNTYIQNGQGITLTSSDKTKSPVKLTNTGLNNGGNKITGVGKGTDDADAVNVAQLKEVNDKVGSGWQIAGNDGQKVADIGAGKKVSFKTGSQYLTANTESAGTDAANVTYGLKTKALTAADGKVSAVDTAEDGLATAKNVAETINQTYWTAASGTFGSGSHTDETANPVDKQISAGDTVTFNAGNNLSLVQNGASFTYGLQANLTGMNTITFTPRNDADGHPISLVIGKQKDGVSNDEGYYITGLDNTSWNQSNYVKNRAATEAQLASAIQQVTLASQSGGFKLSDDNNNEVSQVLGQAIGVVGDSNITTTAETTTADPNGHIKVSLNKHIDLGTDGSLQSGGVTLKNNRVTVGNNGIVISSSDSERTVSNLSNTTWETAKVNQEASAGGYKGSTKAATESQLAEAISTATSTASANEQHIKAGSYSVTAIDNGDGTKSQGVSIDIVTGDGSKPEVVKGKVVIKDVAKASDVGDVSKLHDTLKNPDGTKNVTGAINNLDNRVTGLDTRMNDIYTTAGQHSSVSSESNIVVDHSAKNESGGTDYKLSLNREKIDLDKVTIEGKSGAVTAKTVTAEEYKVGNKTYISSDGLNANSQKITNVQAGTADTDAANVGQVREADEQLAGGIAQNARNISQLGREVDKLDSRIDRVGAGAAALAALHPGAYDPNDKVDFSAGYGNYRGASAAAVGMYYHPDERTILSMGVAMGGGENMVNAGVTWKLGRRTPAAPQPVPVKAAPGAPALVPVSTAAAAPVRPVETAPAVRPVAVRTSVRSVETVAPVAPAARVRPVQPAVAPVRTADTNAQLMELLARQTAILEKLSEQKAVPAAAPAASGDDLFTDVPENHWAYECALKMEKAGVLKGLGGLQVEGNPLLTRKDFARILYTALKNGATTNPALNRDNSLNRMASEFRGELKMVKG
ncbi:YadA-like family protein [Acidaminococcus fermentans]|uniref:YadA-like family protein n=1 Tax=Acidaminococcus fermentans TaxID=905 RepID=UPI00307A5DFA